MERKDLYLLAENETGKISNSELIMSQILLITLLLIGVAVLLLGFRVFFTKKWGFPNTHVDGQPKLREQGLSCHRRQHREAQTHKNLFDRIAEDAQD